MTDTLFRKKSLDRIASPDKLNDYLKTSSPSVWLLLAALALALVAAAVWCFTGSMPTTLLGTGIASATETVCFVPAEDGFAILPDMQVRVTVSGADDTIAGHVVQVAQPVLATDAADAIGAGWLASSLPGEWVCAVSLQLDSESELPAGAVCSVQIILDERRPIDLLLGR